MKIAHYACATFAALAVTGLCAATHAAPKKPTPAPKSATSPFAGSWHVGGARWSFDLDLTVKGKTITGYHSSVADNGNKIDEVNRKDEGPSIRGTVHGSKATVTFVSGYDPEAGGKAVIEVKGNRLTWRTVSHHGNAYFPRIPITLQRQKAGH